jgi:hypothetical protein
MRLTPAGRPAKRQHDKDPKRVATGLQAAASDKHMSKQCGGMVRSQHLGYDCYATGTINGVQKIRCIMRGSRMPPHITPDILQILPTEMWWPERDHRSAHMMVDAVLTFDLGTLTAWRKQWPEHEFGFERFMDLAERRAAALREEAAKVQQAAGVGRVDKGEAAPQGGKAIPGQMALFPAAPVQLDPHGSRSNDGGMNGWATDTFVVRFEDGQSALRVDVSGFLPDGEKLLCSRAYVDLCDGRFEVIRHYPGRLRALHLPLDLLHQAIGVRGRRPPPRVARTHTQRPSFFSETMQESHKVQAMVSTGDPSAPSTREAALAEPPPSRDSAQDAFEPLAFPDAPRAGKSPA